MSPTTPRLCGGAVTLRILQQGRNFSDQQSTLTVQVSFPLGNSWILWLLVRGPFRDDACFHFEALMNGLKLLLQTNRDGGGLVELAGNILPGSTFGRTR